MLTLGNTANYGIFVWEVNNKVQDEELPVLVVNSEFFRSVPLLTHISGYLFHDLIMPLDSFEVDDRASLEDVR